MFQQTNIIPLKHPPAQHSARVLKWVFAEANRVFAEAKRATTEQGIIGRFVRGGVGKGDYKLKSNISISLFGMTYSECFQEPRLSLI